MHARMQASTAVGPPPDIIQATIMDMIGYVRSSTPNSTLVSISNPLQRGQGAGYYMKRYIVTGSINAQVVSTIIRGVCII